MKKILGMLSILTLTTTSISSTMVANTNNNVNAINKFDTREMVIQSPVNSLLVTAGDAWSPRKEWAYKTINLGILRQEQIVNISSTNNDSYTDHKVVNYDYHKIDYNAGLNTGNFRNFFKQGKVSDWIYSDAVAQASNNFYSEVWWSLAWHRSEGTIKFQWYYDADNNLLVDIVGTLFVGAALSAEEGVASIKLGNWITITYNS